MKPKFLIAGCLSLIVLAATTFTGCSESTQSSSIVFVPQIANLIADIQVNNVVNNPVWVATYDFHLKMPGTPKQSSMPLIK